MVRKARFEDMEAINRIENDAIANGFAHFGISPLPLADTEQAFKAKSDRYPWFVKVLEDKVVGFARATPWKSREAYQWTCEVGIYLDPAHQGRGFGRDLYALLFDDLSRQGFHSVVAGITLPNDASVRLHESFGMATVGTFPEMGFKMGAWRSVGYWAKVLNDAVPPAI